MDLCESPHLAGKQMSSSLKERLKRSARFKTSPLLFKTNLSSSPESPHQYDSDVKVLPCDTPEKENKYDLKKTFATPTLALVVPELPLMEEIDKCDDKQKLQEMLLKMKLVCSQQEEKLRKLKMVQLYRSKNDPETFGTLIEKWKLVTQESLKTLHEGLPEPKPTLTDLINHLQIDHNLIGFNNEDDSFS